MTTASTLQVDYGDTSGSTECSGILFEIPNTEVVGGDNVEIRLWGGDFNVLAPYYLLQGTVSMGAGDNILLPSGSFTENVSFANSSTAHTSWSMSGLTNVTALADIAGTTMKAGDDVTAFFSGNSDILTCLDPAPITTTVSATYNVSQEVNVNVDFAQTFKYQAEWPIENIVSIVAINEICAIDPHDGTVYTWASKGENVTARFNKWLGSCIRQVDEVELYGSVLFIYNRVKYYKRWYWPVPIGAEGLYWFFIYKGAIVHNKFSIELPDLTSGIPEPRNIAMKVIARGTDAIIPGASVYIDGMLVGVTDVNGIIYVDNIMQGTHALKITAAGYVDTDLDTLYNDEFVVY